MCIISRSPAFRQFRRENPCKESGTEQSRRGGGGWSGIGAPGQGGRTRARGQSSSGTD